MKAKIKCPVCGRMPCYEHCNECGRSIEIKYSEADRKYVCYDAGTECKHDYCMRNGTRDGKFKDVNLRYQHLDFFEHYVVQERDNKMQKQVKIDIWKKRLGLHEQSGTTYADRLKTEKNLWLAEQWRDYTFKGKSIFDLK